MDYISFAIDIVRDNESERINIKRCLSFYLPPLMVIRRSFNSSLFKFLDQRDCFHRVTLGPRLVSLSFSSFTTRLIPDGDWLDRLYSVIADPPPTKTVEVMRAEIMAMSADRPSSVNPYPVVSPEEMVIRAAIMAAENGDIAAALIGVDEFGFMMREAP